MKLLELVKAIVTSKETIKVGKDFGEIPGKDRCCCP